MCDECYRCSPNTLQIRVLQEVALNAGRGYTKTEQGEESKGRQRGKKRRAGEMRMEEIKTTEKQRKKRARAENHRNAKARTMEREDRKRGRQEERGEWLRQPIFFKQLCFHSTGHQGHYPGVNPQSDGAGSLPGQARVAVHQQGGHEQK